MKLLFATRRWLCSQAGQAETMDIKQSFFKICLVHFFLSWNSPVPVSNGLWKFFCFFFLWQGLTLLKTLCFVRIGGTYRRLVRWLSLASTEDAWHLTAGFSRSLLKPIVSWLGEPFLKSLRMLWTVFSYTLEQLFFTNAKKLSVTLSLIEDRIPG